MNKYWVENEHLIYISSAGGKFKSSLYRMKGKKFNPDEAVKKTIVHRLICGDDKADIGLFDLFEVDYISEEEYNEVYKFFKSASEHIEYIRLLPVLQDYEEREFDEIKTKDFDGIEDIINLAYTTTESGRHEVQVNFNLKKLQWEEYINNKLKRIEKRKSLNEFIDELDNCSFEHIVGDVLCMAEEMEEC